MLPSSDPLLCDVALLYRRAAQLVDALAQAAPELLAKRSGPGPNTFIRLLNKEQVPQLHAPGVPFWAKVAQSVLCNDYRRQKLERAYLEALAMLPEPVVPSLETQAILLETLIALDAALDGLERPVREAFLLSQVDGLGHTEIAQRLAVSVTTVKRYIIKAGALCIMLDHSLDLP